VKALTKAIGKILFAVFGVLVFFWTASLSLAELRQILPGDPIQPYIGLILTDIGALCWLLVFIGQAQGLGQRAIALIMFVVDLAGVILLAGGRLLTGGQTMTEIPQQLGDTLVWGLIGLTILNLLSAYLFHLAEPGTWKAVEFGVLVDKVQKEALDQAQRNIESEAQALGAILSARATAELKYQLRLPLNDNESAVVSRDTHQGQIPAAQMVLDVPAQPMPRQPDVPAWMFWKKNKKTAPHPTQAPAMVANEQTTVARATLKKNPLPTQVDYDLAASIMPGIAAYRACPKCDDIVPLTFTHCAACGQKMTPLSKWSTEPEAEHPPEVVTKCVSCDRPTDGTLLCSICVNSGIKLDTQGKPYRRNPDFEAHQHRPGEIYGPYTEPNYHPIGMEAQQRPQYGPEWEQSTDISPTLDAYAWVCPQCDGTNPAHTHTCQWCLQKRTNGSAITAMPNLPPTKEEPPAAHEASFPG
jgi:hypothetical protein